MSISILLQLCSYMTEEDKAIVKKAHAFATKYHEFQKRKSGEDFITHSEHVAMILARLNQQPITIQAGLLHDVLEDTSCTEESLKKEFGHEVLTMVNGVTKLERINFPSNIEQQVENYRKLFMAMAKDIRVIIIKLADRLHNMRTLHFLSIEKQRRISKETLDIYCPLSHRLGMGTIKWELEDLAFATLHKEEFENIKNLINTKRDEREHIINTMCNITQKLLNEHNISSDISGRPKHFYSIYKKLAEEKIKFSQLFDLYGIRIITDTVTECYQALGYIHNKYKPVEGRLKDYIALPKSNLYQSLHTTVIGPNGNRIEIQIRTKEMHQISEYGIAAHWTYKEKHPQKKSDLDFSWLREILNENQESPTHFLENIKVNLYDDEIFVFTPKGDIIVLPKGATILDCAFKIHTDIGFHFKSGIVNGRIASINYKLKSGDQIEILTKRNAQPSLGWLDIATTRFSKTKIKSFFKKKDTDLRIKLGSTKCKKILIKHGFIKSKKDSISQFLDRIQTKTTYNNHNDILFAISNNDITESFIIKSCRDDNTNDSINPLLQTKHSKKVSQQIIAIEGEVDIESHIAKCCQPLPGDEIIGYITRGYGVAIHERHCKVLASHAKKHTHLLTVATWVEESQNAYSVDLQLTVLDRQGLLKDILDKVSKFNINISKASTKISKKGNAKIFLTCDIRTQEQFYEIKNTLLKLEDILAISRNL